MGGGGEEEESLFLVPVSFLPSSLLFLLPASSYPSPTSPPSPPPPRNCAAGRSEPRRLLYTVHTHHPHHAPRTPHPSTSLFFHVRTLHTHPDSSTRTHTIWTPDCNTKLNFPPPAFAPPLVCCVRRHALCPFFFPCPRRFFPFHLCLLFSPHRRLLFLSPSSPPSSLFSSVPRCAAPRTLGGTRLPKSNPRPPQLSVSCPSSSPPRRPPIVLRPVRPLLPPLLIQEGPLLSSRSLHMSPHIVARASGTANRFPSLTESRDCPPSVVRVSCQVPPHAVLYFVNLPDLRYRYRGSIDARGTGIDVARLAEGPRCARRLDSLDTRLAARLRVRATAPALPLRRL